MTTIHAPAPTAATVVDGRLPHAGECLVVHIPELAGFGFSVCTVEGWSGVEVRLRSDDPVGPIRPGSLVVASDIARRSQVEGVVVSSEPAALTLQVVPPRERRANRRFEVGLPVRLAVLGRGNTEPETALTEDVSSGGLRVTAGCRFLARTRCVVTVTLPDGVELSAGAEILASAATPIDGRYETRLRFVQIAAAERRRLERFLARLAGELEGA